MKTSITLLLAMLALAAHGAEAAVRYECSAVRGKCPAPPAPPAPPTPPTPPAPPTAPAPPFGGHAAPELPAPPALPAPSAPPAPPVPDLPAIPPALHAACAGKRDGSSLSMTLRPGETMAGVCEREDGRMVFHLRSYALED